MKLKIAFVTDPVETIDPQKSATFALMQEARQKGHTVFYLETSDIHINHNVPVGYMAPVVLQVEGEPALSIGHSFLAPLSRMDAILLRRSPPFDDDSAFALRALSLVGPETLVVNSPIATLAASKRLLLLNFPELIPRTLVTKNSRAVNAFLEEVGGRAYLKPLDLGVSRRGFLLEEGDPNTKSIVSTVTSNDDGYVMAQEFLPASSEGFKRVFLLDGKLLGVGRWLPSPDDILGMWSSGAECVEAELTDSDREIVETVGAYLKSRGHHIASLDIVGDKLVEIDVNCPSGLVSIEALVPGSNLVQKVLDTIEQKIEARKRFRCVE